MQSNGLMKFAGVLMLTSLLLAEGGCVAIHLGDTGSSEVKRTLTTEEVRIRSLDGVRPILCRQSRTSAKFSISCDGDISLMQTWTVISRPNSCRSISIGLFPAYWSVVDEKDGGHYVLGCVLVPFSLITNFCLGFTPTIHTLFIEPFSDSYRSHPWLSGTGFIGCYKYYGSRTWFRSFEEDVVDRNTLSTHALSNYAVSVGGKTYECPSLCTEVTLDVPAEAKEVDVTILRLPDVDEGSEKFLKSLVGTTFRVAIR